MKNLDLNGPDYFKKRSRNKEENSDKEFFEKKQCSHFKDASRRARIIYNK